MEDIIFNMEDILVPLGICAVMPVLIVWLVMRSYTRRNENQKEVITVALEKNPNIDIEQLVKSFQPKEKLIKEKLLTRLLWGCICTFCGLLGIIFKLIGGVSLLSDVLLIFVAVLAVGVAFLINYFLGKKMLTREIEVEERKRQQEI